MAIPDRQFTEAELKRAIRAETLFHGRTPPKVAVDRLATALFEHEINSLFHMPDEKAELDRLTQDARDHLLRNACWLLGRLAIVGYHIEYRRK